MRSAGSSHFADKHTEARFMAVLHQQIIKQRFKLAVISATCHQKRSQLTHYAHELPLTIGLSSAASAA
ncbi:hypothetical protein E8A45_00400 [Salmonella enterica]|nr:hypothetical protein [Salmonella enterica]EAW1260832.1 hypothetical protein [Salmonella enterica subsp. diarizonae]EBW1590681.1 hypothetical protein [Salmonella enterica subsp. diarizonae serovar 61:r:z]EAP9195113.1 hypothetical protein [Salmonella enterica]EAT8022673.1 hypothetical protein [Salmonella enterica]